MKYSRLLVITILFLTGAVTRSEADPHGGWHGGGGGWRGGGFYGGGGVVIVSPGYFYPSYPYYYDAPYYSGYYGRPAYYDEGPGTGSIATAVQEELAGRGYYKGPIDGIVGTGTRAAISAYQRNHGLVVSGTIDTPLIRSLRL